MVDAWHQVRAWLACETVWIPQTTERHANLLNELLALPGVHANLVPDAHLAALALEAWAYAVFDRWGFRAISCVALAKPAYPVSWPKKSVRPAPTQRHAHLGNGRLRRVLEHIGKQLAAEMGENDAKYFSHYVNGHDHEQRGSENAADHTLSTKLSTTRFSPALSKWMVSLLPSQAVTLPLPNLWVETRRHRAAHRRCRSGLVRASATLRGRRPPITCAVHFWSARSGRCNRCRGRLGSRCRSRSPWRPARTCRRLYRRRSLAPRRSSWET